VHHSSLSVNDLLLGRVTLHLCLLVVLLSESSCCNLGQLLELYLSIVEATEMVCVCRYEIRFHRVTFANKVKATDLLLEARKNLFLIKDCIDIF